MPIVKIYFATMSKRIGEEAVHQYSAQLDLLRAPDALETAKDDFDPAPALKLWQSLGADDNIGNRQFPVQGVLLNVRLHLGLA